MNFLKVSNNKFLTSTVKLVFLLALFYLFYVQIAELKFNYNDFTVFSHLVVKDWQFLFWAIVLLGINYSIEASKWMILTSSIEKRSFAKALFEIIKGLLFGLFTPFMIGDFFGRSYKFEVKNRAMAISANVFNSICQTYIAIFLGSIALLLWINFYAVPFKLFLKILTTLLIISSFLGVFFIFNLKFNFDLFKKVKILKFFFGDKFSNLKINSRTRFKILFLTLLRNIVYNFQFYLIYKLFGLKIGFFLAFIGFNFIFLVKTIGGGLNVLGDLSLRQIIGLNFFGFYGLDKKLILVATFSIWFLNIFLPALTGLFIKVRK